MPLERQSRLVSAAFLGILLLSVALKIYASQLLVWEVDFVPVVARGQAWLDGGSFPAVGTLSSVAAFNMPFLPWMQLPALLFTRDVRLVLVITQLAFNLLGTWVVFRLGARLFDRAAGMLAAILFTFSDIGISGAYTAWAQLQLPVFTILVAYFLYLWLKENRWWQVALVWISATAAFMTHFSAILLYGVIAVLWLLLRLPKNSRGLALGLVISAAMLAPYLAFEARSDFVDLQAFFSQRSRISAEELAEYAHLKPEAQASPAPEEAAPIQEADPQMPGRQSTRLERAIAWALSIPLQLVTSLRLAFSYRSRQLATVSSGASRHQRRAASFAGAYVSGQVLCTP